MFIPPPEMSLPNKITVDVEDDNLRIQDIDKQVMSFALSIPDAIQWLAKQNYWQIADTNIWRKEK